MEEDLFCSPKGDNVSNFCFKGVLILMLETS